MKTSKISMKANIKKKKKNLQR